MPRVWPVDSIPDSSVVPDGAYLLSIGSIEETANRKGGLMYKCELRVVEPTAFAGSPIYENFNIGSEDDPEAEDPQTWIAAIGSRIMTRMFKAAGVKQDRIIDKMIAAAEGQQVICLISRIIDDGKNDPQYKGRERNRIGGWYAPGEREIHVDGAGPAARTAAKAAVRRPAPTPVIDDEEDEPEPAPAPKAAKKVAPKAAVGVDPGAPKAAAAVAAAAKEKTVKCDICNEDISVKTFSAHVAAHEQEDE